MRAFAAILAGLFALPVGAQAQLELGFDAGVYVEAIDVTDADNVTTVSIPVPMARVGFMATDMISVEVLATLQRISSGDGSFTELMFLPGVNVAIGESGLYVRGEGGFLRLSDEDDSETQYAAGLAAGFKQAIDDGPASVRVEAAYDKWFEDEEAFIPGSDEFRILVGLSVLIG